MLCYITLPAELFYTIFRNDQLTKEHLLHLIKVYVVRLLCQLVISAE
jgi:hypothetical protein